MQLFTASAHRRGVPERRVAERRKARRGFTLLEIVIAVAVITVLAAVVLSVFGRSRRTAHRVQCDTHLKAIALAMDAFKQERGHYPSNLQELRDGNYIGEQEIMSCPEDPRPNPSYEDFYAIRAARDDSNLPVLVCPFHEDTTHGVQAYTGRYTTQFMVSPAHLTDGAAVTVEHPGKAPVAAPVGLELHGADRIQTSGGGYAVITFADGSVANMQGNSQITVLQSFVDSKAKGPLYSVLHQSVGTVRYEVNHGSKFDVVTPTATAGALGTRFTITVSESSTTYLQVEESKVRFTTLSGSIEVPPSDAWYEADPPPQPPPPPGNGAPPPPRHPPPPPKPGPPPPVG